MLIQNTNVQAQDDGQCTPLNISAFHVMKIYSLRYRYKGANIEAQDDQQLTPLHMAVFNGHENEGCKI